MKLHTYWDDALGESEDAKKFAGQGELLRGKPLW